MDDGVEITPADLAIGRQMASSVFWDRYTDYLIARREALLKEPCTTVEAIWRREGKLEQIAVELSGQGFMVEVVRASAERRKALAAGAAYPKPDVTPPWLNPALADDLVE